MALHIFSNESVTLVPHFSEAFSRLHSSIVSQGLSSRKKLIRSVEAAFAGAHQPGHDSGEAWGTRAGCRWCETSHRRRSEPPWSYAPSRCKNCVKLEKKFNDIDDM